MCGVVDAPDCCANSDDACEEDACAECSGDEHVEPGGCLWGECHHGDGDENTKLEGCDEGDFALAVGEDCPEEGSDVCKCWCCDECACEVVECVIVDDAFVEFFDDKPDDAAFCCGDCPGEEEGCSEFAGVVCTREPGHGVWVEGEECEGDEFDGGCGSFYERAFEAVLLA